MYQSSTRKNFLDILLDPTAIAILGSLALHATIGATLPFFTQPDKAGTNGPATVKVVELTPNELQRIPQAPPTPAPQVLPPVTQPTPAPSPQAAPPSAPDEFSTSPQTIPFPSIVGTPQKKKVTPKPKSAPKQQKAKPQKRSTIAIFDPNQIFNAPTPKPSKSPIPKGTPKPSAQPKPTPKTQPLTKKTTSQTTPAPQQQIPATDDDGGDRPPTTPATTPTRQAQQQPATAPPSGTPAAQPTTQPATPPSGEPTGNNNERGLYGKYTQAANAKLQEYLQKYPNIKQYPPKQLSQQYPAGVTCSKVKQPPFIVLMVAFDKVPEGQENNILGSGTSPLLNDEKPYINGDPTMLANKKLLELATTAGFADATEADKQRPAADKGKPVLYTYRVQFDPATCKN